MIAALAFLRAIPSWVWLALALVAAFVLYGEWRNEAGEARVQAKWDAEKAAIAVQMAEAEAAVATKSAEVRSAYDAGVASAAQMKAKEISDAYQRGKAAAGSIRAGTVSVRTVWRDCPASPEGPGAGTGEGSAQVTGERADAIGNLLAAGGGWDATYAECYRRLESAQRLLDACYDGEAK